MTLPSACNQSDCHTTGDGASHVVSMEADQASIKAKYDEYVALHETVNKSVYEANESSGVDEDKIAEAFTLLEDAEDLVFVYEADGSAQGFHNAEYMLGKINSAITKLNSAQTLADEADSGSSPGFDFLPLLLALSILGMVVLYRKRKL